MGGKVMVVGGTGNMGAGIVAHLLERGWDVTVYARGRSVQKPHKDARFIQGDRNDSAAFIAQMRKANCDYAIDMNLMTVQHAKDDFEAFRDVGRLVFTSSVSSYGRLASRETPIREAYRGDVRHWKYGQLKREAEDFLMRHFYEDGFPVTIFRPTITYGYARALVRQVGWENIWLDRIKKGKPIITGDPMILRNFLHADDVAPAFEGALRHQACAGQAYNLVAPKPYDWGAFHLAAMKAVGREVQTVGVSLDQLIAGQSDEYKVTDMITESYRFNGYFCGDKIARDIPEFRERTTLEKGVEKALQYLFEHNLIPNSDDFHWEDDMVRRFGT